MACLWHTLLEGLDEIVDGKRFDKVKSTAQKYRISLLMMPRLHSKHPPWPVRLCPRAT